MVVYFFKVISRIFFLFDTKDRSFCDIIMVVIILSFLLVRVISKRIVVLLYLLVVFLFKKRRLCRVCRLEFRNFGGYFRSLFVYVVGDEFFYIEVEENVY